MPTGFDWVPIVGIVMGTLTVLIPLTLVTLRFAIKPIAEAVGQMRSGGASREEMSLMQQRMALLEQQLAGLETEMEQLAEAQEFQSQLLSPPTE